LDALIPVTAVPAGETALTKLAGGQSATAVDRSVTELSEDNLKSDLLLLDELATL
jgi:hypothetical protein